MTTGTPPRRGFKSKSPAVSDPDSGQASRWRWGAVTRHQISGWRFQIRRLANAVALHDTRMLSDPLRRQARALTVSTLLGVVLVAGAFVLSIIKPAGVTGENALLADRSTNALYVRVNDQLHPVLNLASARLILGKPDDPTLVKSSELDKFPLGPTLGIPGAPGRMSQSSDRDSRWLVCDAAGGSLAGTTVIAGDPVAGPGRATALPAGSALLAKSEGTSGPVTWLIWDNKRAKIDMHNTAVASAVGITIDTPAPRMINRQLLNLIPESAPLVVPFIANAGDPPRFPWPAPGTAPVIGSVVADHQGDQLRYWVVTAEGVQQVSPVIAAMLRAADAHGLIEPPELTPDQIAKAPQVQPLEVDNFPASALNILNPTTDPVACGQWVKLADAPTSSLTLLAGQSLPLSPKASPVALTENGPTTASRVVITPGAGYFVQVTGQHPQSETKESTFWVSDLGVRYGLEDSPNQPAKTAQALGMQTDPLPIPWSVLSLLQPGPALSKDDALVAH